jgi:hypothetical protein
MLQGLKNSTQKQLVLNDAVPIGKLIFLVTRKKNTRMKQCVLSLASAYENPIWYTYPTPKLDTKLDCGAIYG